MQLILEPTQILWLGAGTAVVLTLVGWTVVIVRWHRAGVADMQRLLGQVDQSRGETRALAAITEGLATITQGLAARIGGLDDKLDSRALLSAAASSAPRGYELALRLARTGATIDEITETSGVTRHEAQLLARLHGPRRTA